MQTDNNTVIEELLTLTENAGQAARKFKDLPEAILNFKASPEKWSILECLEHLNRYGEFYLPEIEKALLSDDAKNSSRLYRSGLVGNWFADLMKAKDGKITKMKTPGDKNPSGSELTPITIDRFLKQLDTLKLLLKKSRDADLTKAKVPISLTKMIKLRLGDTLRFFVYHIERHIIQAEKVLKSSNESY